MIKRMRQSNVGTQGLGTSAQKRPEGLVVTRTADTQSDQRSSTESGASAALRRPTHVHFADHDYDVCTVCGCVYVMLEQQPGHVI